MPRDTAFLEPNPAVAGLSYAEFVEYAREAVAAAMESGALLGAGMEAAGREAAQYAQASFASAGEAARGLLGARGFEDVVRFQTDYAKRGFESFVERSAKLSEIGCALVSAGIGARPERAKR